LDRLVGKPVAVVESQHVGLDLSQLYLEALRRSSGAAKAVEISKPFAVEVKPEPR
jgi:hypothetical protein